MQCWYGLLLLPPPILLVRHVYICHLSWLMYILWSNNIVQFHDLHSQMCAEILCTMWGELGIAFPNILMQLPPFS